MADKDILQSVYPHIGGQENISRTIPRENILYVMLKDAGADILVAGNYVFKAENPLQRISTLKNL